MFDIPIIQISISLIFIFLLLSLIVSWINEAIISITGFRGKYLREQLSKALDDKFNKNWSEMVYLHPMVDILSKKESRPPSYISSDLFAMGLIDVIINEGKEISFTQDASLKVKYTEKLASDKTFENFKVGLATLNESDVKTLLESLLAHSNSDLEQLKSNISGWYDTYMARLNGWYKKKLRAWLFAIGLFLAIGLNVDMFTVIPSLWKDANLRTMVATKGENYARENKTYSGPSENDTLKFKDMKNNIHKNYNTFEALGLPVGWDNKTFSCKDIFGPAPVFRIFGWLLTAFALSFGAPFWFDILKKIVTVKDTGMKATQIIKDKLSK